MQAFSFPDAKQLPNLLSHLDSRRFAIREKAASQIRLLGRIALPAIHQKLQEKIRLEMHMRLQQLQTHIQERPLTHKQVITVRVVEVLEKRLTRRPRDNCTRNSSRGSLNHDTATLSNFRIF